MMLGPEILSGGTFTDERGTLSFINDFSFPGVRRFYSIEHCNTAVVRAWQGHKLEQKWFFVSAGAFEIRLVLVDNWENPSDQLKPLRYMLSVDQPQVLHVPPGFANGFRAVEAHSKMLVFSDMDVEESMADNIRFELARWGGWQ